MDPTVSLARPRRAGRLARLTCIGIALTVFPAAGDEIVVGGETAAGKVVRVGPKGLTIETRYGKGNILVPFDRVTTLRTDDPFAVVHGDDGLTTGRLVGVRENTLLVADEAGQVSEIPVATLFDSVTEQAYEESGIARWRSRLRYWDARYDFAFAATDETVNTLSLTTGFEIERRKPRTRFMVNGTYRYGIEDDPDGNDSRDSTTENELIGGLRGEYNLTTRVFSFAAIAAEYDSEESLSLRLLPRAGLGLHVVNRERLRWDVDLAPAYVYQRFFGGSHQRYAAAAFGTDASIGLPFGATLRARGEYLPAVDDWTGDYLLRGNAALQVPMTEWLAVRSTVVNQYDNTPEEDSSRNSLTATLGLSLVF